MAASVTCQRYFVWGRIHKSDSGGARARSAFRRSFAALAPEASSSRCRETAQARWLLTARTSFRSEARGHLALLKALGERHGYEVETMPTVNARRLAGIESGRAAPPSRRRPRGGRDAARGTYEHRGA